MARIDVLPSIEIIRGFKGILDFYLWKGLPCVRAWPKYRPAKQTPASLAAALTFGAIVKSYALLANLALEAYRQDALDQPRTARDIMVTGVFGNLHEASMSDFLDALIIIRDAVVALTDLLHALDSIDTDEIVVNVDQSVLPTGAATLAEQQTQTTALEKLDDLQDTLESVNLNRLLVRGMDQLFSFEGVVARVKAGAVSEAGGYYQSHAVPAGKLWIITAICAYDSTTGPTQIDLYNFHDAATILLNTEKKAFAINQSSCWSGLTYLDVGDTIRAYFAGSLVADVCGIFISGFQMTKET